MADDKLVIEGIDVYNGTYPLDLSYFTMRELHTIKRLAGVRAGEIDEAFTAGDTDVVLAVTVVMLQRATGGEIAEDLLWDAKAGSIRLEAGEVDVPPPPSPAPSGQNGSSGDDSTPPSDPPASDPSPTGVQHWVTGATSGPATFTT